MEITNRFFNNRILMLLHTNQYMNFKFKTARPLRRSSDLIFFTFIIFLFAFRLDFVKCSCELNGVVYQNNSSWQTDCKNCTCINAIPFCQPIQCTYEPCETGKVFVLQGDDCCPKCRSPKKSCIYNGFVIQHNTEFSPKICETCKCKNEVLECIDHCKTTSTTSASALDKVEEDDNKVHDNQAPIFITTPMAVNQRKGRILEAKYPHNHRARNNKDSVSLAPLPNDSEKRSCIFDNNFYKLNATWSPLKCTKCICNSNLVANCFVSECPTLNCPNGYDMNEDDCCPKCKETNFCEDGGLYYKSGDFWTRKDDPCTHCSCINGTTNCFKENCTSAQCKSNQVLITKSNVCCPQCVSQISDNCEYYGRIYYNGEMWYNNGCQHCACDYGKVICMNVQCESTFCFKDEIMVKKKDDCCIECRKPLYCDVGNGLKIKENEFWRPHGSEYEVKPYHQSVAQLENSCKLCQCVEGKLNCFVNSCKYLKYPSYAHLKVKPNQKKQINARTIPFFADIIKSMRKDSSVFVISGPKFGSFYVNNVPTRSFTVGDLANSRLYYITDASNRIFESDSNDTNLLFTQNDFASLSLVSSETGVVHNMFLLFEFSQSETDLFVKSNEDIETQNPESRTQLWNSLEQELANKIKKTNSKKTVRYNGESENERVIRGYKYGKEVMSLVGADGPSSLPPRKTIYVHPGEAIKLTTGELEPKNLGSHFNSNRLIYVLVSGNLKYGELKLKKVFSYDETTLPDWNQVNDIYMEKSIREFTQLDLLNGNVWYEPYSDLSMSRDKSGCRNRGQSKRLCEPGEICDEGNDSDCDPSLSSSDSNGPKYDHCMFEVYDQDNLDKLISKEIIHFNIQTNVINETFLGLEVLENQLTPLAFSNFDIAGIDSSREYLIYRIIKGLDKAQGQIEHVNQPGIPIEKFTQNDLNRGFILYRSPKEIGVNTREFTFSFVVTNDNRSDTFPETPFHIKVSPSNDQAPSFKETITNLKLMQTSSLTLPRDLFDVDDPDTSIENIIFTIEKAPENSIIELRTRGQRYIINKDDSFTMQEVRDGTFRLIHNGANVESDVLKISASDGKHASIKTIYLQIQLSDKIAPRVDNKTSMLLNVKEGQTKTIRRENLAFVDDKSSMQDIIYTLVAKETNNKNNVNDFNAGANSKLKGKLYLKDKPLKTSMVFTQADIDMQNLKYEAPQEIGAYILTEIIHLNVNDKEGNSVRDQIFTINVDPVDNQAPIVEIAQPVTVTEGGYLVLNENLIRIRDTDSSKDRLSLIIDSQPSFGYIENTQKGTKINSFSLNDLINDNSIRYVQDDHLNKEPNTDFFIFHVTDGINESPTYKFVIDIEPVNDEAPISAFKPLIVDYNQQTPLTNSTLLIVDFDSKPEEIKLLVEELPKYGKLYFNNAPLNSISNSKFTYADILNKAISYKLEEKAADSDEVKFKITDGKFTIHPTFQVKKSISSKASLPYLEKNEGLQAISGHLFPITREMLKANYKPEGAQGDKAKSENRENFIYKIVELPSFGKLQYRFDSHFSDFTSEKSSKSSAANNNLNAFTQIDIDQGRIFYNHGLEESSGVTSLTFNVSDSHNNVLPDQKFIISVRGDKLPPSVILNKGLRVNQGQSSFLSRVNIDVKDDDTLLQNLQFIIITQPKMGYLENVKEPGKRIKKFMYEDLAFNRIKYVQDVSIIHDARSGPISEYSLKTISKIADNSRDSIDFKISDGKNDASASLAISIIRNDNHMPKLKSSYNVRVRELQRVKLTPNELKIVDDDTADDQLKFIITHPPQYGVLEKLTMVSQADKQAQNKIEDKHILINTSLNQTLNLILKFNQNSTNQAMSPKAHYVPVNEFSMADVNAGLIYYSHRSTGVNVDRFGFIIYDGYNNMFLLDDGTNVQASNVQIFNVQIETDVNKMPTIEKNIGLDYLYKIDGLPGRLIMRNELEVVDKDDDPASLVIEVVRPCTYGILEHKDRPGQPVRNFTQNDINQNKIYYLLKQSESGITNDHFMFDVHDSANNVLRQNRFDIKWAVLNFELTEISVLEEEGKARVHIKREGNLKQYSMVTCKTQSDSAKSNRDSKQYDFIHSTVKIEFNEDESYKACDIIIQKDSQIEPIESFFVIMEEPKYAIIGNKGRVKINILDKQKDVTVEFEKIKYEVQESDKFISIPIIRSGDLTSEVQVECLTQDESAFNNQDYVPRKKNGPNIVKIPAGEVYGFCDIEIIDDDLHELTTETFKILLVNTPSNIFKIGKNSEARVSIIGPNDVSNNCKIVNYEVNESAGQIVFELTRPNTEIALDVSLTTIPSSEISMRSYLSQYNENNRNNMNGLTSKHYNLKKTGFSDPAYNSMWVNSRGDKKTVTANISHASPNEDFVSINEVVKFMPGEASKKVQVTILNDLNYPIMEGLEMFTIQIKPMVNKKFTDNEIYCSLISPNVVNIIIDDTLDDKIVVGFNQTNYVVKESDRFIRIPIVREGDLSKPFSVMCYTRQLTATENTDYIGRSSLEQSRIYFDAGDRSKDCVIEVINDSVFEADETFSVKLSDLRGPVDAQFSESTTATLTIINNEDSSIISFSSENYYTEEPSSSDQSVIKPITILRTGDLSRTSIVRVSTVDNTALAGLDYKPKTEMITFNPGVSALDFDVQILFDNDREQTENFKVIMGPQVPISALFGKITSASVIIADNYGLKNRTNEAKNENRVTYPNANKASSESSNEEAPYLMSLHNFVTNKTSNDKFNSESIKELLASSSEPLICLHYCDSRNPNYGKHKSECKRNYPYFNESLISFSWEISSPNEFGTYSQYVKLTDNTFFSFVNQSVLEPIYFRPKYRVRCVTQMLKLTHQYQANDYYQFMSSEQPLSDGGNLMAISKSNYLEIVGSDHFKSEENKKKCYDFWRSSTAGNGETSKADKTPFSTAAFEKNDFTDSILSANFLFINPFKVKVDYISADYITRNPNSPDVDYLNYVRLSVELPYVDGTIPLVSTIPLYNYRYLLTDPAFTRHHVCSNFISKNDASFIKYGFLDNVNSRLDKELDSVFSFKSETPSSSAKYLEALASQYRNKKTIDFYSRLDEEKCNWKYVAYYDISELTSYCQAQIVSDSDIRDEHSEKNFLTLKIPLYISYVYYSNKQASWPSIEHKTEVEASIVYKTNELPGENGQKGNDFLQFKLNGSHPSKNDDSMRTVYNNGVNDVDDSQVTLSVYKIALTQDGKLILEFSTVPSFHGQFIRYHPSIKSFESSIRGPSKQDSEFNLELIWSQYTYDYPEQIWKATSKSILNNYSGNYTVQLVPCYAKADQAFKYPYDCEPKAPITIVIPISLEQTMRPIPAKYSLDTTFTLSSKPQNSSSSSSTKFDIFDGYFRKGDTVYGTVAWNGNEDLRSNYKLEIDKVYVCSSDIEGFMPIYDPDGTVYNRGPQFGCLDSNKAIRSTYLILNRRDPSQTAVKSALLNARFSNDAPLFIASSINRFDPSRYMELDQTVDGFRFNVDGLLELDKEHASSPSDLTWFVQVTFSMSTTDEARHIGSRRFGADSNAYELNSLHNNGTNMQILKFTSKQGMSILFSSSNGKKWAKDGRNKSLGKSTADSNLTSKELGQSISSTRSAFTKVVLPLIAVFAIVLMITMALLYAKRKSNVNVLACSDKFYPSRSSSISKHAMSANLNTKTNNTSTISSIENSEEGADQPLFKFGDFLVNKKFKINRCKRLNTRSPKKGTDAVNAANTSRNYSETNSASGTLVVMPLLEGASSPEQPSQHCDKIQIVKKVEEIKVIHANITNNPQSSPLSPLDAASRTETPSRNLNLLTKSPHSTTSTKSAFSAAKESISKQLMVIHKAMPQRDKDPVNNYENSNDENENVYYEDYDHQNHNRGGVNNEDDEDDSYTRNTKKSFENDAYTYTSPGRTANKGTKNLGSFLKKMSKKPNSIFNSSKHQSDSKSPSSQKKSYDYTSLKKSKSNSFNISAPAPVVRMPTAEATGISTTTNRLSMNRPLSYVSQRNEQEPETNVNTTFQITTPNANVNTNNNNMSTPSSSNHVTVGGPAKIRNNYLYFNYNNNKMHYLTNENSDDFLEDTDVLMNGAQMTTASAKLMMIAPVPQQQAHSIQSPHLHQQQQHQFQYPQSPQQHLQHSNSFTAETIAISSIVSSSTPTQLTPVSTATKCLLTSKVKRLSGTEV